MTSLPFKDLPKLVLPHIAFAEFWIRYPRKVSKRTAETAYSKALVRVGTPEAHDTILDGLARYRTNKPAYADWCHPATWLNGNRWEDEYDTPSKPDPDLAWQHKAAMAKTSWGRHHVVYQDIEECHRRGLLTDEELAEALR